MNYSAGNATCIAHASGVLPRTKQPRALRSLLPRTKPVRAEFADGTQLSQAKVMHKVSASIHRSDEHATRSNEMDKTPHGSSSLGQSVDSVSLV